MATVRMRPPGAADAEFKESDHPRKPAGSSGGGQFTAGGAGSSSAGGGAASTPAGKYIVNSHVGLVLKKFGYKKSADENGNLVFKGPENHKVIIHPPSGGATKSSSAWTLFKPDQSKISKVGIQLEQYLTKAHGEKPAEQPKPSAAVPNPAASGDFEKTKGYLSSHGWTLTSNPATAAVVNYSKEGANIVYTNNGADAGTWVASSPGHLTKTGKGYQSLTDLLEGKPGNFTNVSGEASPMAKGTAPAKPAATAPAPAAPKPIPKPPETPEHAKLLKELAAARIPPTGVESYAVAHYKGSGYTHMNDCLRHQENCGDSNVHAMAQWLDKQSLPKDIVLYRGVRGDYAKILRSILMVGTKFTDRGFMSCSTKEDFSASWAGSGHKQGGLVFKINIPKGTKGAAIEGGGHDSEYEIVLQRGYAMHVKSYDRKNKTVEVDLLVEHVNEIN